MKKYISVAAGLALLLSGMSSASTLPNVVMVGGAPNPATISVGQTSIFSAQFASLPASNTVLLDFELYDSGSQKVAQKFYDNVVLPQAESGDGQVVYTMTAPATLPAGTYQFKVGIFTPHWAQLIHWYNSAGTLTVSGPGPMGDHNVVAVNYSVNPTSIPSGGQTATLRAQLDSPNTPNTIILDFELHDSTGAKIFQKHWDNLTIPQNGFPGQVDFETGSPSNLPAGTYRFYVGIFNPDWSLIHWYNTGDTLTVGSGGTTTSTQQIFVVRVDRPKMNLANGSSTTIAPTLINTGPTLSNLTVKVSLWRGGNFIDQKVSSNVTLEQNVEQTFSFTTIPLMQGSYTIKTDVLDASGNTIQSFPDLGTIAVNP